MRSVGVCSWSLRPSGPVDLAARVKACGLDAVQLALDPVRDGRWSEAETIDQLRKGGIRVLSGMMAMKGENYASLESIRLTGGVRSDAHWPDNLAAAVQNAALAERLGIDLVTFHAGFLPHDAADPLRAVMIDRLRQIADAFASQGVKTALETGQETAQTLIGALRELDHSSIGVNFDPANMILYGMGEPVAALEALAPWVRQIHIKDALPTQTPGMWGTEVVVGDGAVEWSRFFDVADEKLPSVDLLIEREAREDRVNDIRAANELIRTMALRRTENRDA